MSPALHVVLGAGPAGTTTVDELLSRGLRVRHVNRGPIKNALTGVEVVQADVSDPDQARAATQGAAAIYHAVNVPYHQQVDLMPGIAGSILAAATHHGARLVVLDTLYPYGEADGEAITENTPWAATSRKGRMRAALDQTYLDAHRAGEAEVVLGRSADFYGPRVLLSTLGATFFPAALAGEPVLAFGDIDLPHSYTYLPDVAQALVDLGTAAPDATGRVWHLPTAPAITTKQVHDLVERLTGRPLTRQVLEGPTPTGPFDAQFMAEYAELFYQHEIPQNMISTAFEERFDRSPTPLEEGIKNTLDWYRAHPLNF
ncbi:NAD-dependent epimerase/dehydratase family protein [Saccharopolyspora sp. NPDC000359]|uniref:NAD-dependent epimerase/dehydratase family protein n=1 Tax=Saccharopolyspora sp. NPDC000359 TaxID=3154251 RepID=UPI00332CBCCF